VAFVLLPHCTNALTQAAVAPQAIPASDQFFDSNGVRIRYVIVGQGEPIILIHGWAADAEMWASATQDLSRNFRVIALDCRGHGKSGKPTDPSQYGNVDTADIVGPGIFDSFRCPFIGVCLSRMQRIAPKMPLTVEKLVKKKDCYKQG